MPQKKHSLFKYFLQQLLKFLSEKYPEYPNFIMYKEIVKEMSLVSIEDLFDELEGSVKEYKKEIDAKDEMFFIHLKPTKVSSNFIIINEISNIKKLYHLPKTTEQDRNTIWEFISKIASTFN